MKLKDGFVSIIRGAIIGIGSTIPFASLSGLMVGIGIYKNVCHAISNFFKDIKQNTILLFSIILGILLGYIVAKDTMPFFLDNYKEQTIFLFIGIIYGGISYILKDIKPKKSIKGFILFLIIFICYILFSIFTKLDLNIINDNLIMTIIIGVISGFTIFIPGLSELVIIKLFKVPSFTMFLGNNNFTLVYIIGLILGIIIIAKIFSYLYKKNNILLEYIILSLLLSSIALLILNIGKFTFNFTNVFTSILTFLWGYILAQKIREE